MSAKSKKIVLAYSGGLDTSVMLHWLKHEYDAEIVAYCADVGQEEELEGLEEKALKTGASEVFIEDLREEFVKDYVFSAIKAQAVYEGVYLMGTSLARPIIAKRQVEIAQKIGATALSHGATGKGNDQVRFEFAFAALDPSLEIIAPWRVWPFKGRKDLIDYANKHNIEVLVSAKKPYSIDRNIMHISFEGGELEDPWFEPKESMFQLSKSIDDAPDNAEYIEISFLKGEPVALNGKKLSPVGLLRNLNIIAGKHGVGRVDIVENRYVGIKSRGVYETPGVSCLHIAHRALESITLDREQVKLRDSLATKISEIIYNGYWFAPEMKMILSMLNEMQKDVNGDLRVKLHKGNCILVGRRSNQSLYSKELASFEEGGDFDQRDAQGFIKLNSLRLKKLGKSNAI